MIFGFGIFYCVHKKIICRSFDNCREQNFTKGERECFAGKTHTARYVLLYEEMVIFGTLAGCFVTIFPEYSQWGNYLREHFPEQMRLWTAAGIGAQAVFGLFAGMFIGCLALAIAEMLDSIPIFARRISFRHGLGWAILGMAAGKICGSLFYFATELHRTVQ